MDTDGACTFTRKLSFAKERYDQLTVHMKSWRTLKTERYNYQLGLLSIPQSQYDFLWVDSFPLFTREKESNTLRSTHHPFTAPCPEDLELLNSDPEKAKNFLDTCNLQSACGKLTLQTGCVCVFARSMLSTMIW